ncbi:MAG: TIGR03564 family F420-dependent LLM class oxidoreductase [Alphaproteobacteria bacterium]|nr:TIGR03564 family F420-dependent LLM class oxidoreductase [Alphaproteobacteria bacterium]
MQIGVTRGAAGANNLNGVIARAKELETRGFPTMWMVQGFGHDAISALSIAGRETSRIELGTSVVPIQPRHPVALAQQALTAATACGGRFTLGIGLSHKVMIEDMLGLSYDKPGKHMQEYLAVLMPLLRGERVNYAGEQYNVNTGVDIEDAPQPVRVLLAALGPMMLRLAGAETDGTITWLTGLNTLERHIVPSINKAARDAGRPAPRIVAGLPMLLTNDPDAARATLAGYLKFYEALPSYRAMLDREGAAGPADVAIVGGENVLDDAIARLQDIGITDLRASITSVGGDSEQRTVDYLASKL